MAGLATRSVRSLFVNGTPEDVGYIGHLRVDHAHRGRWLVSPGFRFLHHLHQDGQATGYVTTIIEGNAEAEAILVEKARRHYPAYRKVDRLVTLAIWVRRQRRPPAAPCEVLSGAQVELDEVVAYLHEQGRRRQFFPFLTADDLTGVRTRDFRVADLAVACRAGAIVGVLGLWDQSRYKQTVVRSYSTALRRLRPFYNIGARLLGGQPLAGIGQPIHFAYASFACVQDDDPAIFQALLAQVYNLAVRRRYAFLMLGLSARDPLLAVAQTWRHIPYTSTLYTVCWPEEQWWHDRLDERVPYVEIATL